MSFLRNAVYLFYQTETAGVVDFYDEDRAREIAGTFSPGRGGMGEGFPRVIALA